MRCDETCVPAALRVAHDEHLNQGHLKVASLVGNRLLVLRELDAYASIRTDTCGERRRERALPCAPRRREQWRVVAGPCEPRKRRGVGERAADEGEAA